MYTDSTSPFFRRWVIFGIILIMKFLIKVIFQVRIIFINSILLQIAALITLLRSRVSFILLLEFIRKSLDEVAADSARYCSSTHQHRVGSSIAIRLPGLRKELTQSLIQGLRIHETCAWQTFIQILISVPRSSIILQLLLVSIESSSVPMLWKLDINFLIERHRRTFIVDITSFFRRYLFCPLKSKEVLSPLFVLELFYIVVCFNRI